MVTLAGVRLPFALGCHSIFNSEFETEKPRSFGDFELLQYGQPLPLFRL